MVRPLILALAGSLSLLIASAHANLDLTPKLSEYELDGVKFQQLAFADGSKIVTYAPPRGWDYSGNATQLTLRPRNKSQAEATIKKVALAQPASFDDGTVKKLVEEAIAAVPAGSTDIQLVSKEKNPLRIERKETFLVTLSYNLYGAAYNRSILFLNRGMEQIQFQLSCRRADFKELQAAFLDSQHSWQNL
jgi:hypothetical protein